MPNVHVHIKSNSWWEQRFENEISMWAQLKHENILAFYGIVTDLGQHIHMVGLIDYKEFRTLADKHRYLRGKRTAMY